MLCFEISINGKLEKLIGCKETDTLGLSLYNMPEISKELSVLTAEGTTPTNANYPDPLSWLKKSIKIGDEVIIKVS